MFSRVKERIICVGKLFTALDSSLNLFSKHKSWPADFLFFGIIFLLVKNTTFFDLENCFAFL